jgi:hypothetical protein
MNAIGECTLFFNPDKLAADIFNLIFKDLNFSYEQYDKINQIALHDTSDWFDGTGSLYDYQLKQFTRETSEFTKTHPLLEGTYLGNCIEEVRAFALKHNSVKIGRIRVMRLQPKTCYTLHQDPEDFRFHIPIFTNPGAMFIVDNEIGRMPFAGYLYRFRTNAPHTAVNASFHERIHIVFDTYRDEE